MKFIDTSVLRVGYDEWNPDGRATVILVHGWPDSPRCWNDVAALLARTGLRVLAPALRGFAPTTFLNAQTPRSGQLAALGRDLLEFIDALGIETKPALVGHDWGARAVGNACGLRRDVASHLMMLSVGYGTNDPKQTISLQQARNYWYHWYMATPRGERELRDNRRAFTQWLWDTWAPAGWYRSEEFDATAAAFDGPDWADVVLHSYRHRWAFVDGDARYAQDEAALNPAPLLDVPTLVLHGEQDTCNHPDSSAGKERFFTGAYRRELLARVGHFPQREAPQEVAQAVLRFMGVHGGAAR